MLAFIEQTGQQIVWITAVSLTALALSLLAAGSIVVALPAEYFRESRVRRDTVTSRVRTCLGAVLVLAGLAMTAFGLPALAAPALVTGAMIADFPGKTALERWALRHTRVLRVVNAVRWEFDRAPLTAPHTASAPRSRPSAAPALS